MIKTTWRPLAILVIVALSLSVFALARAGPKQKAFTHQAIVTAHVPPIVANVPPMTVGYDVINNLTAYPRLASVNQYTADTSVASRLSTMVDWRSTNAIPANATARQTPDIVLLA